MTPNTSNGALLRQFLDRGAFVEVAGPKNEPRRSPALAAAAAAGIAFLSVVSASIVGPDSHDGETAQHEVVISQAVAPPEAEPTPEEFAARQARIVETINAQDHPRFDHDLDLYPLDDPEAPPYERLLAAGFNSSSAKLAEGIHPDMVTILVEARKRVGLDVQVVPESGGLRNLAMQRLLVKRGNSWTLNSNHRTGRAVDLVVYQSGLAMFNDLGGLRQIAAAMMQVAGELEVDLGWGGNWKKKVDMYHFELPRDHIAIADRPKKPEFEEEQPVVVAYGR